MESINWFVYWFLIAIALFTAIVSIVADEDTRIYRATKDIAWTVLIVLIVYLYGTIWIWGN